MRITDMPSLGAHARSHQIRRDLTHVLSSIGIAASRGVDVSDHVAAFRAVLAVCAKELKTISSGRKSSVSLNDI